MTMILDSEKLNPQYNQNSVLTMPWIAWGGPGPPDPLPLGYGPDTIYILAILHFSVNDITCSKPFLFLFLHGVVTRFRKMPKDLLIRNGKLRNFAYTFVTSFPTDLPS